MMLDVNDNYIFRVPRLMNYVPDDEYKDFIKGMKNIKTDIFDKSITEFEYKLGVYEKSERCYLIDGIAPTITCSDDIKIIVY